jgi:hypothetical protein
VSWAGRDYIGLDLFLDVEIKSAVSIS